MSLWQRWKSYYIDMTGCNRGEQSGFTLVEVLVASGVLSLIMVAVFSLLLAANRVQDRAVQEGNLMVDAQRLLNNMIDGKEGLISAQDLKLYAEQNGYLAALAYIVDDDGSSVKISYQWDGTTVYRTSSVDNSLTQPPVGLGSSIATGITHFVVDDSEFPIISLELGSGGTLFQTKVTLRN